MYGLSKNGDRSGRKGPLPAELTVVDSPWDDLRLIHVVKVEDINFEVCATNFGRLKALDFFSARPQDAI